MKRNKRLESYCKMSDIELRSIENTLCVFQELVLSMIRNAVYVLPENDVLIKKKNINSTKKLMASKEALKNAEYANFINTKDVFLSSIIDGERRSFFKKTISNFTINNRKRIKFCIKHKNYEILDLQSKKYFSNDIRKIEKIINTINCNFIKALPAAKRRGLMIKNKINTNIVPIKAKYNEKKKKNIYILAEKK